MYCPGCHKALDTSLTSCDRCGWQIALGQCIPRAEHDRIVAEKDAEIARLRAALLSGKAFAEDWIAEHGGIDGCDYSDRLAFENMCAALGDTDE